MNLQANQRGFTIVELLIVIVVIAILAAISIVAYTGIQERARNSSAQQLASQIASKAETYYAINGRYPISAAEFNGSGNQESNLEGANVTIRTGTPASATASATYGSGGTATAALAQFNAGTRVVYTASANGYVIHYLGSGSAPITKGATPTGTATFGSNEGATS